MDGGFESSSGDFLQKVKKQKTSIAGGSIDDHKKQSKQKAVEEIDMDDLDSIGCITDYGSPPDDEIWRKYYKQVEESDGFDIFDYPGTSIWAPQVPIHINNPHDVDLRAAANLALYYYNHERLNTGGYKVSKILKATVNFVGGVMYHITFKAFASGLLVLRATGNNPDVKIFQAKVLQEFPSMELVIQFCRLKNESSYSKEEIEEVAKKPKKKRVEEVAVAGGLESSSSGPSLSPLKEVTMADSPPPRPGMRPRGNIKTRPSGGSHPLNIKDHDGVLKQGAILAIYHFNYQYRTHYKFSKLVKARGSLVAGYMYSITFEASEQRTGFVKSFEAHVWSQLWMVKKLKVNFVGLKNES